MIKRRPFTFNFLLETEGLSYEILPQNRTKGPPELKEKEKRIKCNGGIVKVDGRSITV